MEKDIEKAIRETIVIRNKEGLKYAVNRISRVINSRLSELEEDNRLLKLTLKNASSQTDVMCWVAVSKNKPEIGQWLLVYAPTGRHIAWYNGYQFEDRADYNIEGVTHWVKIPEPPCM